MTSTSPRLRAGIKELHSMSLHFVGMPSFSPRYLARSPSKPVGSSPSWVMMYGSPPLESPPQRSTAGIPGSGGGALDQDEQPAASKAMSKQFRAWPRPRAPSCAG